MQKHTLEAHGLGKKMRLLPLIGATYFMVAGGPYGLEDILGLAGYGRALLLLLLVPLVWSLPTSLMVGELASALPAEGGYYIWVRRALGGFWGFQNAWLSLAASIFDMAIYPVTFVAYLTRIAPTWTAGPRGTLWALAVVVGCAAWNLRGAKAVGDSSLWLFAALLSPFVFLIAAGMWRAHIAHAGFTNLTAGTTTPDLAGALAVCLWNYMGWDNASTVAQEVENPQRTYPRAMLLTAGLVAVTYILPLAAAALAGIPAAQFSTGAWADAARALLPAHAGATLALFIVLGGCLSGIGMFNALMLSYTRVPYALAEEKLLPAAFLRRTRSGAPWVSVLVLAAAWALALRMSFERLISIDLVLYGASLILEFLALVVLRRREPALARPFKIPGGLPVAILVGLFPTTLILFALYTSRTERVAGLPSLVFSSLVALAGPILYLAAMHFNRKKRSTDQGG